MLRQNESREFLGKYLNDPRVLCRHKRREMMAIARTILVAKWLAKIKLRSDAGGRLCKRARKQRGASQPFWQKSDQQWVPQLCRSLAELPEASAAGNLLLEGASASESDFA